MNKQCRYNGKACYTTKDHADSMIKGRDGLKEAGIQLESYYCVACFSWHLTSFKTVKQPKSQEQLEREHTPEKFK